MNWKLVHLLDRISRYMTPAFLLKELRHAAGKNTGLSTLNFSFTSRCSADCIFCPSCRGNSSHTSFMPKKLLKKILDEIVSASFRHCHNLRIISVGENGDLFTHPDYLSFLRLIRQTLPGIKIVCYTNFLQLTPDRIDTILKEKLLDFIGCNIDAINPDRYRTIKRGDYYSARNNLDYFLFKRRKLWCNVPIHVSALTLYDYITAIQSSFGRLPSKLPHGEFLNEPIEDDFEDIYQELRPQLDHPKDKILRTPPIAWAERGSAGDVKLPDNRYTCPQIGRIEKEAFIAPDGTWYACCWDSKYELALGNLYVQSLQEIHASEIRQDLILKLKQRRFSSIGSPCRTVNCCQPLIPGIQARHD
ncbi:MAG: radical SAM/SPASM domain-containing protein [Candidatus Omnitrophota bacterium]